MVDGGHIGPGSPAPRNPAEVEALLRVVPRIAFFPEVDAVLPAPLGDAEPSPAAVARGADEAWLGRLVEAWCVLEDRADRHDDGGLRFLAVTLRHFLTEQRVEPADHPLVVALFLRTAARRGDLNDHPNDIGRALNAW